MASDESDTEAEATDAPERDDEIISDLESKYAGVICPVHNVPPSFDVDEKGSMIERFCCEALMQIFHELRATDPGDDAEA